MDGFIGRFQKYFDKMQTQGRKVELSILTSPSFEGSLDKEYKIEGDSYPLKEIISAWITENALSEPNSSGGSKTKMTLKDIRIPLTKVNKLVKSGKPSAVNAASFLEDLKKYLKKLQFVAMKSTECALISKCSTLFLNLFFNTSESRANKRSS